MKIRTKLLFLLLAIALLPLGISAALHHLSLYRFGRLLAADTNRYLTENAHSHLHSLVKEYGNRLRRDRAQLETLVRLLAARAGGFLQQTSLNDSMLDLALQDAFPYLSPRNHFLFSRQFIALETGQVLVDPKANPGSDSPPSLSEWYRTTLERGGFTLTVALGTNSEAPKLIASMAITGPAEDCIGVAAVEVPIALLFEEFQLPTEWGGTQQFLLLLETGKGGEPGLRILAQKDGSPPGVGGHYLIPDEQLELAALVADLQSGRSGVRTIFYQGRKTHWVYGVFEDGQPFPLIIVSHDQIVAQAAAAEARVRERMLRDLQLTGLMALGIAVVVVILAYRFSRTVTRPLDDFAAAAERLAASDYSARVDIRTADEFEDLGKIFNGIGPKLQEREKMTHALALAGKIQRHLLPEKMPKIRGYDIAGGGIYCDETGGDYYDFLNLTNGENGKLGIVVGDVSGHGIGAALLMASARGVLRTHAVCDEGDMASLFRLLNHHLLRDAGDEGFMTLFYGVLDLHERTLRWNSAGHGPVLLRRHSGKIEELSPTGLPLGIMRETQWVPSDPLFLHPEDTLLIGTDGLWETRNPAGGVLGIERLQEVLGGCTKKSAGEIYTEVMQTVTIFRDGGRQEDDITLVVVKVCTPTDGSADAE